MAKKKKGSLFMYQTDRRRLDLIEEEAAKKKLTAKVMLDYIIDEYFGVEPEESHQPEDNRPWYLR